MDEDCVVEHLVHHCRQRYAWDCGVACVLMLLDAEDRRLLRRQLRQVCDEEGFGKAVWTIDLCFLLNRYGIDNIMYTTLVGVNQESMKLGYYGSRIRVVVLYITDFGRVEARFASASAHGVGVVERSVSLQDITDHLAHYGPIIALVEMSMLVCDVCKNNLAKYLLNELVCCGRAGYTGHYVLLVGYDGTRGAVLYRDPQVVAQLCRVSEHRLLRAARAPGTDEDMIFVYKSFL